LVGLSVVAGVPLQAQTTGPAQARSGDLAMFQFAVDDLDRLDREWAVTTPGA